MPFPGCGRSQDVKLASRGILTSPKSPRANPMFPPRAVAPTLHGRFFSGRAYRTNNTWQGPYGNAHLVRQLAWDGASCCIKCIKLCIVMKIIASNRSLLFVVVVALHLNFTLELAERHVRVIVETPSHFSRQVSDSNKDRLFAPKDARC